MKIAVAYIRVSTDMQTEYSPDSQLKLIKDYAAKNDMILGDVYADEGISGTKVEKRDEFKRMITDAKAGNFDVILIYHTSRFARNHEESTVYRNMLKRKGIDVISITQPSVDYKTDLLMNAINSVIDEWYSIDLSANVKRGMKEKASRGQHFTKPPFGYARPDKGKPMVIVEDESLVIKYIFDEYESGNGMYLIAKRLSDKGYRTKNGIVFSKVRIRQILVNPVYKGYLSWASDGETMIVKADHEPIISEAQFEAVQKRIAEAGRKYRYKVRDSAYCSHWLTGVIRCPECGTTFTHVKMESHGRANRFRCGRSSNASCKIRFSIMAHEMESIVLSTLEAATPETVQFVKSTSTSTKIENVSQKNIKNLEKSLERVKRAFEEGIDTLEEYKANKARITAEISRLTQMQETDNEKPITNATFREKVTGLVATLRSDRDINTKNMAVKQVISKIVPDPKTKKFTFYFFE